MKSIIKEMSRVLNIDEDYLYNIASNSKYYYRQYSIAKKNGGTRTIFQPSAELKILQSWLVDVYMSRLPISELCFSYRRGKSIKNIALLHKDNDRILHLDIKDFFESITGIHLDKLIDKNAHFFSDVDLEELKLFSKQVALSNGKLRIGSVSSPLISNAILYNFDAKLENICKLKKLIYGRYADDIYLSSKNFIDSSIIDEVGELLQEEGFQLNKSKTRLMTKKNKRTITGLIITNNGNVSLGLKKKRQIKCRVYGFVAKGIGDRMEIMGHLAFLKMIEPTYYDLLITKYCKYDRFSELVGSHI